MNESTALENRRAAGELLRAVAAADPGRIGGTLAEAYHPDARWNGSHPLDELEGPEAIERVVWRPFKEAFPDLERRDQLVLAGRFEERDWVGAVGHYAGTFTRDWLDIPATGGVAYVRYGEFHALREGRIATSYVLVDFLDLMRQAGVWPIAPSLGAEGLWPGPATQDGALLVLRDAARSPDSLELVQAMHRGLLSYDGKSLASMHQVDFWHPDMMWYGPAGIGTTRRLKGFEDFHQVPFLQAFPDRVAGGHYVRIAEGDYVANGGWPSVRATHLGGGWLGLGPTGRKVGMRVMDFYRCDGDTIAENWIPFDIIDVLRQLGVDAFARMRRLRGSREG